MQHHIYDLSTLAKRLFSERKHLKLAAHIKRTLELKSLCADLEMARDTLARLQSIRSENPENSDWVVESALLSNAIILYARATKTTSKERAGFDLRSRFSDAQATVHAEITDLRDSAVAHFGSGGSYLGEWKDEVVVLHEVDGTSRVGVVVRRQTYDRALTERIFAQINVAAALLKPLFDESLVVTGNELQKLITEVVGFSADIMRYPLDLGMFIKSVKTAQDAVRIIRSGSGVVHHS